MKKVIILIFISILITVLNSCNQGVKKNDNENSKKLSKEQIDSINRAKEDSIRKIDSIRIQKQLVRDDSIARIEKIERQEKVKVLSGKFRAVKDEFENRSWIYHKTSSKYTNENDVHLYFQKNTYGSVSNLRFRIQYEGDDWLFIENIVFNIDGNNMRYTPRDVKSDCGYGGRIWEWVDEPAYYNSKIVENIAKAKVVKMKFNGKQYYDIRKMSPKKIQAFKETLEYYKALGGTI